MRERLVDAIAAQLGMDRIEIRRRNHDQRKREMPYPRPLEALGEEIHYDTGDYVGLLDKLFAKIDWDKLNADVKTRKAAGELVGIGIAMFVEKSGLGPTDGVKISIDTSGAVEVLTGGASIGQGFETVMAQVAADALGVDYRRCPGDPRPDRPHPVRHRRARLARHGDDGIGDPYRGAERARQGARSRRRIAANHARRARHHRWRGCAQRDRSAGPSISLGKIAQNLAPGTKTLGERTPGLSAEGWFKTEHQVYPYGSHVAVVRVDRDTGGVAIERYVIAYDIGRAINPALVKGQIVGGFAQGLGGALFEEFTYSERGDPLAVTFADYLMPAVHETPPPDVLLREDYTTPAQSARHQGRRRKRHHRRRRRDRVGDRRRHRHSRRGDASFRSRRSGSRRCSVSDDSAGT